MAKITAVNILQYKPQEPMLHNFLGPNFDNKLECLSLASF